MKNKIGKIIWKIIGYKLVKKQKYYHTEFREWIKDDKYRIIHPLGFLLMIFAFIYMIFTDGIIDAIKDIPKDFCIF